MADFRLVQSVYGLLLGLWVGAMVMVVVAATAAFGYIRGLDGILMVSLAGWSEPLVDSGAEGFLAGGFVGAMLGRLVVVQLICAVGLALCVLAQFLWFPSALIGGRESKRQGVRVFLLAVPAAIVVFNMIVVSPGVDRWRDAKYDPPEGWSASQIEAAEANFEVYHQLSTRTYGVSTLMLLGALAMTPWCLREPSEAEPLATESTEDTEAAEAAEAAEDRP
ncbi:MAG: hypothetical protein AAGF84_09005 [Planctomycetota bacterium]